MTIYHDENNHKDEDEESESDEDKDIEDDHLTIIDVDITMVVRELLRRLASNLWQTSHVSPE
jgi:hypothetical protein